jgi:hypothetical protein
MRKIQFMLLAALLGSVLGAPISPSLAFASDYKWVENPARTIAENSDRIGIEAEEFYKHIVESITPPTNEVCTELPSIERFAVALTRLGEYQRHADALRDLFEEQGVEFAEAVREVILEVQCRPAPPVCG